MLCHVPRRRLLPPLAAVLIVALAPFVVPVSTQAQSSAGKRTLEIADYAQWRTISGSQISDDGRWVAWAYSRVRGDDTLHVSALDSDASHVIALASGAELSDDGAWVAYFLSPPFLKAEKLRRDDETVTRQAGLLELATGTSLTWDDASSFGFSEGSSHFFLKKRKTNDEAEHEGTDLILRNLREGFEELIGSVGEAEFNDGGTHLAFTVDAEGKDGNGLYLLDLATGSRRGLDNAKERYARLTWSEEGDALAVLRGDKQEKKVERENSLIAFRDVMDRSPTRIDIDSTGNGGLADGMVLSEKGNLVWNEDANILFVATKQQDAELDDWPEDDLALADVNIWHWADDRIQSQQEQSASRDRDRTYVATVDLERGTVVPLADERMRTLEITRDGRWAIGRDETEYTSDWRPDLADLYRLDSRTGERLTVLEGQLRTLGLSPDSKAANAERYLFSAQTFQEYPDLYVSGNDFAGRTRVTDANPQQDEFLWGNRILFDYTNDDGVPLQGTLAIPDDYEPGQRLPMLVRFYEKYSQDLHLYPTPTFRHSPNFAGYVSNGYLVMQPDVHFRIGSSHSDMLESVEAAVRKVVEMGYADPEAVALSGHSYSGGGSAYIATRSDMFSAIAHGAAPINLVSEFNQLFVGSGQNNHSYDIYGQGRYATNPYDDFQRYWDESPISGVQNMNTPVLYLHGESDPTVNWEQGLEWYNALRFLGKEIIWLSYPDEGHGLRKLQNRVDFQYRLRQFFGHHLKGEPAPSWMTDGVPYLDKDRRMREFAPRIFQADSTRIISEPQEPPEPTQPKGHIR
jgi:dipeptidyl aminopeptidase/acylaminoacyl peptidase